MATAKHKFQKLVFNPANQKLVDFLDELRRLAKDAFGIAAHAIIEEFIYAKMPPHLKKSIDQTHLEIGTYEQIVTHQETELELNGLEAPDELQIYTVNHNNANANADRPNPTCHHCKKPGYYKNQCRLLKKQREQTEIIKIIQETKTVMPITLTRAAMSTILITTTETVTEQKESQELFTHPVRHVTRQTIPQRNVIVEPMQQIDRLPGREDRKDKIRSKKEPIKMTQVKLLRLQPKI